MNADMDEGMGAGSAVAVAGKSMNKQGTPPVWLPSFTKGTNTDIRKAGNLKKLPATLGRKFQPEVLGEPVEPRHQSGRQQSSLNIGALTCNRGAI